MTLTKALGATRYKYPFKGRLLEVKCPKCSKEIDSYTHILQRYGLQDHNVTGVHAIEFLVNMAIKVTTSPPNPIFPVMVQP